MLFRRQVSPLMQGRLGLDASEKYVTYFQIDGGSCVYL